MNPNRQIRIQDLEWFIDAREKEIQHINTKLRNIAASNGKNPPPLGKVTELEDRKSALEQKNERDRKELATLQQQK